LLNTKVDFIREKTLDFEVVNGVPEAVKDEAIAAAKGEPWWRFGRN